MKSRKETRALHERTAEDKFAAYELTDSEDFDKRQMARNILRYQLRQYCFELPPTCSRWGRGCFSCSHLKCRENELYDGEKWSYDFDPDIDRFASLWENLSGMATVSYKGLARRHGGRCGDPSSHRHGVFDEFPIIRPL